LLESVRAFWSAVPRHRNPVYARDGWRCAVPGCSSRRNLHDHHVIFRSRGGLNSQDNRVAVCASHHLHGLHGGRIRAAGRYGIELIWEIGLNRRGGEPLLRISSRGEVYRGRSPVPGVDDDTEYVTLRECDPEDSSHSKQSGASAAESWAMSA
jgi:hypothetical protein